MHVDFLKKHYKPLLDKTLRNALAHRIGQEFPRIGGPRMLGLCADVVMEVLAQHQRPRETVSHGQVLWSAISVDDPPTRGKTTAQTQMVPVVLDLSTPGDVEARIDGVRPSERLLGKAVRLCQEAYAQGGLLSGSDLAELLATDQNRIAQLLAAYERRTGKLVPRRATIHDVGTGLTHKAIICRKRYLEGKEPDQVARETHHTLEAVDRYLGQFDRVRCCRKLGMSPEATAHMLQCSLRLVREYLVLDAELDNPHA